MMGKTSSAVKMKYNRAVYKRYEFNVNKDTKLNYLLEQYKRNPDNSLSSLVKDLLCKHFGVKADEIYLPSRLEKVNGEWVELPNELK